VVGVLFALYHMEPLGLLSLSLLGLVFGYFYFASGSLLPGMAGHFTNNFLVTLWLSLGATKVSAVVALCALPFALGAVYLFRRSAAAPRISVNCEAPVMHRN
jgi:membrane protease YdiL (CAAX protease family)